MIDLKTLKVGKQIALFALNIEDGFAFSNLESPRYHHGTRVSNASGIGVFRKFRNNLTCTCCGREANIWLASTQSKRDKTFVMNLFSKDEGGNLVLMTRDHIIPKMLGGSDHVDNMRVMCSNCNGERGVEMDEEALEFLINAPAHLKVQHRVDSGLNRLLTRAYCYGEPDFDKVGFTNHLFQYNTISNFLKEKCVTIPEYENLNSKLQEIMKALIEGGSPDGA